MSLLVAAAVGGLVAGGLAACGTRLPDAAFAPTGQSPAGGPQAVALPGGGSTGPAAAGGTASGPASAGVAGVAAGAGGQGPAAATAGSASAGVGGTVGQGAGTGPGGAPAQANLASDVGVTATTITIGNVTSITGPFGPDTLGPTLYGLTAYVDAVNDRGGVNGRKLDLVTCDDGAEGSQFLACDQKLVEQDHVFALIASNSDASAAGAHYEYTKGVPDVGPPLNNGYYKYPTMFSMYGTGYPRDGKTVGYKGNIETPVGEYEWFKDRLHISRAAVFYYVIPVSVQAGCFEERGLAAVGVPTVYEGGGGRGNCTGAGENPAAPAFDEDVINMKSKGVDTVWDGMDVSANARLCQAMDRQGFTVKAKVSTVDVYSQSVGTTFSSPCRDSVFVGGSSDTFADTSNPLVRQFRTDFARYQAGRTMHQWALEGWALGYELTQAVSSMGADVTRQGFMRWLNSFPPRPSGYTYGGLFVPINYAPADYSAPAPDCTTVAQWSDAVGTWVQRAGTDNCPVAPYVATHATPDGS